MSQQQYDNNRRGALWHARERRSERSPHFTGTLEIDGVKYDVSMWENQDAHGRKPLFTMRVTPQSEREQRGNVGQYGQNRDRPALQRERPPERGLPLDQNMIDDDLSW